MRDLMTFTPLAGTQAKPNRPNSSYSWSRTKALRSWCRQSERRNPHRRKTMNVEGGDAMLDLQAGDRIELFYDDAPATAIRATVGRLLTDCEEGMGIEVEDYTACWIEISIDEPINMDAKQVVLLGADFQYRLNGRQVTLRKRICHTVFFQG